MLYLMDGLRECQVHSVLACPGGSDIEAAATAAGHQVAAIPMGGDLDLAMAPRLASLTREHSPALVHLHSRRGAPWYGAWAARRAGVPAVLSRRVDNPPSWLDRWLMRSRAYGHIVTISDQIRDVLLHADVAPTAVSCVPSAVQAERFAHPHPRQWFAKTFSVPADGLLLGIVAQLIPRKGHAVLLQAMPRIAAAFPNARLLVFGQGPLREPLQQQASQLGLGGRVYFAGFRDDMPKVLGGLDLLVHPALAEGLGVALLEAAAAGCARIACAAGGMPQTVIHEQTGLLVAPGEAQPLGDAVIRLLGDAALRDRLARKAGEQVRAQHSVASMTQGNLAVYRQVLGAGTDARGVRA